MDFVDVYLSKHGFCPEIGEHPHPRLNICVVIPCFNEPSLLESLQSLWNCIRPQSAVEVIIVINSPEHARSDILTNNLDTLRDANVWIQAHVDPMLRFYTVFKPDLPVKFAGVGLARKIGMDEAVYRFSKVKNQRGIIAGFDADSLCSSNYLVEIERHFSSNPKTPGASIYFEHPTTGSFNSSIYQGICLYEMHLRYINQALRFAGHPHAYHTVGSSFAVTTEAYVKQGGMNKRQAGEDFYFLQKIIALGNFSEINTTRVVPSARVSNRVPFGTGASMGRWTEDGVMKTYSLIAFEDIRVFISMVDSLYETMDKSLSSIMGTLSPALCEFLYMNNVEDELISIRSNSASLATFRIRFFRWFNVFKVIKYMNFAHDKFYEKVDVAKEAITLAYKLGFSDISFEAEDLLTFYRKLDSSGFGIISR